ncbi:cupin domain-containing protein [Candidatus Thiosymbion oneisti]|uniref:cupin domain-containing protein n=1 Tax=Candidatus Thiosymbion oneisti TaxID=589554 RepID=UPI000B7CE11D|nr:cupin domain-containing protein [Candidatus Thiosymbion oneisti]
MEKRNIYAKIPADLSNEVFEVLVQSKKVKIERIVSKGHTSPDTGWYDQEQNEWVIVLKGNADISFENGPVINLKEGEYINIPAYKRHKVINTSIIPETVWLAVHY